MNFPAQYIVMIDGKPHYLCYKHLYGKVGEKLPEGHSIVCEECHADFYSN